MHKEAAAPGDNKTGRVKAALFDFDGTISVIRQGWESVMAPLMLEIISGRPADQASSDLKEMVHAYIEKSTGIQTIEQMIWLTEKAERINVNPDRPKDPWQCKDIYIKRLHQHIQYRRQELSTSVVEPDRYRVAGCADWLAFLKDQDITMYLASGSDEKDVIEEADLLGIRHYFDIIAGAQPYELNCAKKKVILKLLEDYQLSPENLIVVGDGPVEIQIGVDTGARTIGVASDELNRQGINQAKVDRLKKAGADKIIGDFLPESIAPVNEWLRLERQNCSRP